MAAARVERGDLWKNKALSVQLRLRERFRVEVDRRLKLHPIFTDDGYFSSTFQRWLQRFRDFRRDSLPSSTVFYRKRGIFSINFFCVCLIPLLYSEPIEIWLMCFCHYFFPYFLKIATSFNKIRGGGLSLVSEEITNF